MMLINSPCYKCVERSLGCHSKCVLYVIYKNRIEAIKKPLKYQYIVTTYAVDKVEEIKAGQRKGRNR